MKTRMVLLTISGLLALAATAQDPADDPVARIAAYKFGDSREPLSAVENLVRTSLAAPEQRAPLAARLAALLGAEATLECKQFVSSQLALIGGAPEVPALAALLTDPNTADMARYALERIPGQEADAALLEALATNTGVTRIGIVNSLGNRKCAAAVPALSELTKNEDAALAEACVAALGHVGTPDACAALEALALEARPEFADTLNAHLLGCADAMLVAGQKTDAIRIYNSIMASPGHARVAAFQGMINALGDEGVNLMLLRLKEGDPDFREMAVRVARTLPGEDVTRRLAETGSELDAAGQIMVLGVLAERGGAEARGAAIAATESADESVRGAAIAALAKLGTEADVMMLARMAAGTQGGERDAVRDALYKLRGDAVGPEILKNIPSGDSAVRVELIRAAAERRTQDAVPLLLTSATDSEPGVRNASFKALADLASPSDLDALLGILAGATSDEDRESAERTIVSVMMRTGDEQARTAPIMAACGAATDPILKASLIRILGSLGDSPALDTIRAAAQDTDEAVRLAAVSALADWPRPEVVDDLAGILARETLPGIRDRALRGYVRVLAIPSARPLSDVVARCEQMLAAAANDDEKRAILSGLGKIRSLGALKTATPHLENEALRTETIAAVLDLSRPLCGAYRAEVETALARIEQLTQDENTLKRITSIREMTAGFEDFIVAWEVAGPYQEAGKGLGDLFDCAFPPEDPAATSVAWQLMPTGVSAERPWLLDLDNLFGGSDVVAYLRTTIVAPADTAALLLLGSDDAVKAWLNGSLVHALNTARGVTPDEDRVPIALKQGENSLLLKIINGGSDWGACARLRAPDGSPLPDVSCIIR